MWVWIVGVVIWGYAIGCLHGSVVAHKLSGVDLKETGVKNAGASNAMIVLGKKFGALVAAIDIGKGALAILVTREIVISTALSDVKITALLFLAGAATVVGHNFPFYMNFKGGKGTATVIGVLFALDWRMGLAGFALFIIITLVTDFIVVGVLMLYIALLASSFRVDGYWPIIISSSLVVMAILKHLENFKRMKEGNEKRVSSVFKKKEQGHQG